MILQPRYEIFSLFHEVLLLGQSARVVFQGSGSGVLELLVFELISTTWKQIPASIKYFKSLGYEFPVHSNPADVLMGKCCYLI